MNPARQILTKAQKDIWYEIDQLIECVTAPRSFITLKQPIQIEGDDCGIFECRFAFDLITGNRLSCSNIPSTRKEIGHEIPEILTTKD